MHFLVYFTLQVTLIMLNILHKDEDHENHARWIYLTTVLNIGQGWKYARMILTAWLKLVLMMPGAIPLMRIFFSAQAGTRALIKPSRAVLHTEYGEIS